MGGAGVAVVSLIGDDAAKECKSYPYLKNSPVCESTLIFKLIMVRAQALQCQKVPCLQLR